MAHLAKPLKLGEMLLLLLLLLRRKRLPACRSGNRATFNGAGAEQSNQQRDRRGDTHGSLQLNTTRVNEGTPRAKSIVREKLQELVREEREGTMQYTEPHDLFFFGGFWVCLFCAILFPFPVSI